MFNLKSIWKSGQNIPQDLIQRIEALETDNTTNKQNITALENKIIQWTNILNLTTGNIPNTEQNVTLPNLINNHTYVVKIGLKTSNDKLQEFTWMVLKENINWKSSPIFTFYNDLDYSTKVGDFKIVFGMGQNTLGKIKIAQPSGQTVSVSNGFSIYIGEVI